MISSIHLGSKVGSYYDNIRKIPKQVSYKITDNLLFDKRSEMFDRIYEQFDDFLPYPNTLVLDIGMQYGDYAVICNRVYKSDVIGFEPFPPNWEILQKTIMRNKALVKWYPYALSNTIKTAYIDESMDMLNYFRSKEGSQYRIRYLPLDRFRFEPELMKVDVEGYEMEVFEGGIETLRAAHPRIIVETHSRDLKRRVVDFLGNLGYVKMHEDEPRIGKIMDSSQNLFFRWDA